MIVDATINSKKYKIPAISSIPIYLVLIYGVLFCFHEVAYTYFRNLYDLILFSPALIVMAVLICTIFMMRVVDRKPFLDLGFAWKGYQKDVFLGFLTALFLLGVGMAICLLTNSVDIVSVAWHPGELSLYFLFFILVAFTEEIVFRGYILRRMLDTRMNHWCSLLISSLLFATIHISNDGFNWLAFISLLMAGVILGLSYIYTRNLWFPISLHLFWNWIQGPILGFEVSGIMLDGSLIKQMRPVDNLINGGAFGFEGSLLCIILIVIATFMIGYYYRMQRDTQAEIENTLTLLEKEVDEESSN